MSEALYSYTLYRPTDASFTTQKQAITTHILQMKKLVQMGKSGIRDHLVSKQPC